MRIATKALNSSVVKSEGTSIVSIPVVESAPITETLTVLKAEEIAANNQVAAAELKDDVSAVQEAARKARAARARANAISFIYRNRHGS